MGRQCVHLICLPTVLPADFKEQEGRTHHNHVHEPSAVLWILEFLIFWVAAIIFPHDFLSESTRYHKSMERQELCKSWSSRKSERHTTTSGTTPFHLEQLRKHLASPKNTRRFSTKTLRESPPVLSMRPYTGNLGSGIALISSVHWKAWIRCSTHI